ncbi:LOW QUALITY PROTEIN: uncharacterized protein EMH_0055740 [Eimeria mitis]|uniref:Uncharacterized protein n=1 Tax=Eimeria mitis TaxID=44415 RepID=U6JXE4_9EIME|nr:LOW QUALITY PROTEIN: uncharacterized protein EMH_0055740 [Eimeria mitis]CDJ30155.1 hypothetical protein, conserved [Eimeria mitis]
MESLFKFLLQEDSPGESFDPRAARPHCKVCGADAWLQWDGHYADYCSRSCRDKHVGDQSPLPAPGPPHPLQRRGGGTKGPPDMLGERQAQLQQEKEDQGCSCEESRPGFSPTAAALGAFAEAAAAKKAARALRQKAPRKALARGSIGPRMEGGPPSAAATPRKMPSIVPSGSEDRQPLQRQRTVARFVEQGEDAVELQTALKEYQENLSRQRQKLEEERTVSGAAAGADAEHLRRSVITAATAGADAEPTAEQKRKETEASIQLLQQERAKYEEQMKAIKKESEQQLQLHKEELVAEVKRLAAEEFDVQKVLEKELGEVRASLQHLRQQQEQQRQQQQQLLQKELEEHIRAQLQHNLEQQLGRKLREQLQEEVGQQLQQQLQRKQEHLKDSDGAETIEVRRSKERLLREELLEQQLRQEKRLQQQLLQQQQQQEKLLHQLQQQEQTLQRLTVAAGQRSSASGHLRPSYIGEEMAYDQQLRDLLLQGLFSHLRTHDSQRQQSAQDQQQQQQQRQQQHTTASGNRARKTSSNSSSNGSNKIH